MCMFLDSTVILSRWTIHFIHNGHTKKIVHIMNQLPDDVCYKGYDRSMPYIATFHTIAKRFRLVMKLINSKWNDNICY